MEETRSFYRTRPYTWQSNIDPLFRFALSVLFGRAAELLTRHGRGALLDAGCGAGDFLDYYSGGSYTGIDISEENIRKARERYPGREFLAMDATRTTFPDNTFDAIVCVETLEHLTLGEIDQLLQEMRRICKKGGQIVITTPNLYYLWGPIPWSVWPFRRRLTLRKWIKGWREGYVNEHYNLPVHHYRFRPSFLRSMLQRYFSLLSMESTYWYNNRAIHGRWPALQMRWMQFSARHKFLGLDLGCQLVCDLRNDLKPAQENTHAS